MKAFRPVIAILLFSFLLLTGCTGTGGNGSYALLKLSDRPVFGFLPGTDTPEGSTEIPEESGQTEETEPEESEPEETDVPEETSSEGSSAPFEKTGPEENLTVTSSSERSESPQTTEQASTKETASSPSSEESTEEQKSSETEAPSATAKPEVVLSDGTVVRKIDADVHDLTTDTFITGHYIGCPLSVRVGESGRFLRSDEYTLYPDPSYDPSLYTFLPDGSFTFHAPGDYTLIADCQGITDTFVLRFIPWEEHLSDLILILRDAPAGRIGGEVRWNDDMTIILIGSYEYPPYEMMSSCGLYAGSYAEWNHDQSALVFSEGEGAFEVIAVTEEYDLYNVTNRCSFSTDLFSPLTEPCYEVEIRFGKRSTMLYLITTSRE